MTGGSTPPASRKIVCNGDRLLRLNVSRNPPGLPRSAVWVTSTLVSSSMAAFGRGTGTAGPTMTVSDMRLAIGGSRWSRDAFGQRDPQPPAELLGQFVRPQGDVRVADLPVLLRVAEVS